MPGWKQQHCIFMMKLERYSVILNLRYGSEPLFKMPSLITILHSYGDTVLYGAGKSPHPHPPACVWKHKCFVANWKRYKNSETARGEGGGEGLVIRRWTGSSLLVSRSSSSHNSRRRNDRPPLGTKLVGKDWKSKATEIWMYVQSYKDVKVERQGV